MIVPIPPRRPDSPQPLRGRGGEARRGPEDEDDELLRRLDANELYDIHQGLAWCEREMRATGLLRLGRRRQIAALRQRWAHRWRAATGRPAMSLQAQRAWQLAAVAGLGLALLAAIDGPERQAPPIRLLSTPPVTVVAPPTGQSAGVTDEVAKSRARDLASHLQQCRQVSRTFLGCVDIAASQLDPTMRISDVTESRFKVTSAANTGNVFTLVSGPDGAIVATCTVQGEGGCPAGGRW